MLVTRRSMISNVVHTREVPVTQEQLDHWTKRNDLIQNVFPNLSQDDREFLMTGVTPEEWDAMFNDLDDDFYDTTYIDNEDAF